MKTDDANASPKEQSTAELVLQLFAIYQEVQDTIDDLLARRCIELGDMFGGWLQKRIEKLTDEERRKAFMALAEDAGLGNTVRLVPNVWGDAKKIRDSLAHGTVTAMSEGGARTTKDGAIVRVTDERLHTAAWQMFWVLEHVLYVAEKSERSETGLFGLRRLSGALFADTPPASVPPTGAITDQVRVPRFQHRYALMQERDQRREAKSDYSVR